MKFTVLIFVIIFFFFNSLYASDVCTYIEGAILVANDGTYLGKFSHHLDSESILNNLGTYGRKHSAKSIWNKYGTYGSKWSSQSPFNNHTSTPPKIIKNRKFIGYLTVNKLKTVAINPYILKKCKFLSNSKPHTAPRFTNQSEFSKNSMNNHLNFLDSKNTNTHLVTIPKASKNTLPTWNKNSVQPFVLLQYNTISDFIPIEGGSIYSYSWKKDNIKPIVFLKYHEYNNFVPIEGGNSYSASWKKNEVTPIMLLKYDSDLGFIPKYYKGDTVPVWTSYIKPVISLKYDMYNDLIPINGGDSYSPSWKKHEVDPVVLLIHHEYNDLIPKNGGNGYSPSWKKEDVKPYVLTLYDSQNGIVPKFYDSDPPPSWEINEVMPIIIVKYDKTYDFIPE